MSHCSRQNLASFRFNREGKSDFSGELYSEKASYLFALNINLDNLVKPKLSKRA